MDVEQDGNSAPSFADLAKVEQDYNSVPSFVDLVKDDQEAPSIPFRPSATAVQSQDFDNWFPGDKEPFELVGQRSSGSADIDVAASDSGFRSVLFDAQLGTVQATAIKLPWETGYLQQIFGEEDILPNSVTVRTCECGGTSSVLAEAGAGAEQLVGECNQTTPTNIPVFALSIKSRVERDFFKELDRLWTIALNKWYKVFDMLGFPGQLGEVISIESTQENPEMINRALRDELGIKSPRTALKRAP